MYANKLLCQITTTIITMKEFETHLYTYNNSYYNSLYKHIPSKQLSNNSILMQTICTVLKMLSTYT